ncbi:MAG: DUF86 domain-containing protein [Cyanobacteria bacterium]|jgi:uncharacterized protein with HEPN domain|nr:DUF86 domain-containing protein [Cyanobacteria bacterium GSL.Bin21]
MRRDSERLQDILDAIDRIQSRFDLDQIEDDEMLQVWVLYHLQIIGEAARALSSEIMQNYSQVPWSKIVGLRNRVVHEYFDIDLDIVIDIVTYDLPELKEQITEILNNYSDSE